MSEERKRSDEEKMCHGRRTRCRSIDTIEKLEAKIESQKQTIQRKNTTLWDIAKIVEQQNLIKRQNSRLREQECTIVATETRIDFLCSRNSKLQGDLDKVREKIEELQAEYDAYRFGNDCVQTRVKELETKIELNECEITGIYVELDSEYIKSLERKNDSLIKEISELAFAKDAIASRNVSLLASNKVLVGRLEFEEATLGSFATTLHDVSVGNKRLSESNKNLTTRNEALVRRIEELEAVMNDAIYVVRKDFLPGTVAERLANSLESVL